MEPEETIVESLQTLWRAVHQGPAEGLTPALHGLLRRLERDGPQGVTSLARQLGVLPSSVTVASQRLERMGLVERRRGRGDERRVELALTDSGREAIAATRRRRAERLRRAVSTLAPEERERLAALLRALEEAVLAGGEEVAAAGSS